MSIQVKHQFLEGNVNDRRIARAMSTGNLGHVVSIDQTVTNAPLNICVRENREQNNPLIFAIHIELDNLVGGRPLVTVTHGSCTMSSFTFKPTYQVDVSPKMETRYTSIKEVERAWDDEFDGAAEMELAREDHLREVQANLQSPCVTPEPFDDDEFTTSSANTHTPVVPKKESKPKSDTKLSAEEAVDALSQFTTMIAPLPFKIRQNGMFDIQVRGKWYGMGIKCDVRDKSMTLTMMKDPPSTKKGKEPKFKLMSISQCIHAKHDLGQQFSPPSGVSNDLELCEAFQNVYRKLLMLRQA